MKTQRRYFETFDGLRFIAFFLVFLSHSPIKKIPFLNFLTNSGGIGVSFFFVLSGFLISYILLFEKKTSKKIKLRFFFTRRVLRIWPLFYLLILFAWITPYILDALNLPFSNNGYEPNWLFSVLFLENYQMMIAGDFPNVSPLGVMWSLCIEEHFYIIWGILFYLTSIKNIPKVIVFSILTSIIARFVYSFYSLDSLDIFTNLDLFAYGAIPAYLLITKPTFFEKLKKINSAIKYIIVLLTLFCVLLFGNTDFVGEAFLSPIILGSLFSLIIFFTLPTKNRIFIPNHFMISKMGKYTYGLYLYHTICITLVLQLSSKLIITDNDVFQNIFLTFIAFVLSVIISVISFYIFEKRFLKLKKYLY